MSQRDQVGESDADVSLRTATTCRMTKRNVSIVMRSEGLCSVWDRSSTATSVLDKCISQINIHTSSIAITSCRKLQNKNSESSV